MDIKKILEKLDGMQAAAAKPTGPSFPGYWKGSDSAKLSRKKMVGGAEESVIKELTDVAKEKQGEWKLQEKFKSFKEQTPDKLEITPTSSQPNNSAGSVQVTPIPEPNISVTKLPNKPNETPVRLQGRVRYPPQSTASDTPNVTAVPASQTNVTGATAPETPVAKEPSTTGIDSDTKLKAMQYLTPGQTGAPASAPGINRAAWSPELLKKYDELIKQADSAVKTEPTTTNVTPSATRPPVSEPPKVYNRVDPIPVQPSQATKISSTVAPTGVSPESLASLGTAASIMSPIATAAGAALTTPRNVGQKYPWPSEGPLKGSEINPNTKKPWTKQELDTYNKDPNAYTAPLAASTRAGDFKKQTLSPGKNLDKETIARYKDVISKLESGKNYDVAFIAKGLKTPEQWSGGKKLTDMTLDDVKRFQQARGPLDNAVGRYQFMQPVLFGTTDAKGRLTPGLVQKLGLKGDTKFTPEVQERIHDAYLQGNIDSLVNQKVPVNPATLYSAHSIGAGGTGTVFSALKTNPNITVADALARQHGAPGSREHRNHIAMLTKRNPHLNTLVKDWIPRMERKTQPVKSVQKESVVDKFLSEFKQFLEYENTQDPNKQTTSPKTSAATTGAEDQKAQRDQQIDIATAKGTMSGLKSSIGADLDVNAAASAATKIADGQPLSGPEQSAISSLTPLIAKAAETPQTASTLKTALQGAATLSKLGK